jgi:hypothetical protein
MISVSLTSNSVEACIPLLLDSGLSIFLPMGFVSLAPE